MVQSYSHRFFFLNTICVYVNTIFVSSPNLSTKSPKVNKTCLIIFYQNVYVSSFSRCYDEDDVMNRK